MSQSLLFFFFLKASLSNLYRFSFNWETGTVGIKWRILKNKLLFYHHIKCLPNSSLAKEVLGVQAGLRLQGLYTDCRGFLCHHGVNNVEQFSKVQWKRMVKKKILQMNEDELVKKSLTKKNINFSGEKFAFKGYFQEMRIEDARSMFKICMNMLPRLFKWISWVAVGHRRIHLLTDLFRALWEKKKTSSGWAGPSSALAVAWS